MSGYGSGIYGIGIYGGGPALTTTISQSTLYGSRRYENLVLGHLPTALFGSYVSATNTIDDETNHEFLTATLAGGATVTNQIPFFSLADLNYTFNIATANAITIAENTSVVSKSQGSGRFSKGDEGSQFSFEFLFSHNYGNTTDIVKFGNSSASPQMKIYYSKNAFVLDIYGNLTSNLSLTSGTKLRYRATIQDNDIAESKHIAVVFDKGVPNLYVNGIKANIIVDELLKQVFFDEKTSGSRTIAKFDGGANASGLVSMIAMYNYAISEDIIRSHYAAALNLEETNSYASKYATTLLNNPNGIKESLERNTEGSQDFNGTNIYNTYYVKNSILPAPFYNFEQYSINKNAKEVPSVNYSILWKDFGSNFDAVNDSISLTFQGRTTTGSYSADNCLLSIQGISFNNYQDELYVGIDATSKLYIATAASGVLATSSATIPRSARTVTISLYSSAVNVNDITSGASVSASTTTQDISDAVAYFYNGYTTSTVTGLEVERGNSQIDIITASFGTKYQTGYHTEYLSKQGSAEYYIDINSSARALIQIPIPSNNTLFFSASSTPTASYQLLTDGTAQSINNNSEITSSSAASAVAIQVDINSYKNYSSGIVNWIKVINTESFSESDGSYETRLINANGIHSNPNDSFILSKQNTLGFLNKSNSLTYVTRSSQLYTGSVTASTTTTTITGIPSTDTFKVGQYIMKSSGSGSIGAGASITSIDSDSQITISAASANAAGSITFYVDPIGQLDFLLSIPKNPNILTNPSFESGIAPFYANGAGTSASVINTDSYSGSKCLEVTKGAVAYAGAVTSGVEFPAQELKPYTFSTYIKVPAGNETSTIRIGLVFYTSSVTYINIVYGTPVTISSSNGWTKVSASAIAPATTASMGVYIWQPTAGTAGQKFLIDNMLLEQSSSVNSYFEGSSSMYLMYNIPNLITNPSIETNTTGWGAGAASLSLSRITTDAYSGSACLQVVSTNPSGGGAYHDSPVLSGVTYTGSMYIKLVSGGARNMGVAFLWYSSAGFISSTAGTLRSTASADGWQRFSVTGTAPTGATTGILIASNAASGTYYIDAAMVQISSNLNSYTENTASSMYLTYNSTSNVYILNFTGMTASVNNSAAISGTTKINPSNLYMIQASLNNPLPDGESMITVSSSTSSSQFVHSFKQLSTYPFGLTNQNKRYSQIFGRATHYVSDSTTPFINVSSIPENVNAYNQEWQSYGS